MRTAGSLILAPPILAPLIVALLSGCAQVEPNHADSQARPVGENTAPARYLTCGLPSDENKLRCAEKAAATCPGGFTVSGPYPDLPHLIYACN